MDKENLFRICVVVFMGSGMITVALIIRAIMSGALKWVH